MNRPFFIGLAGPSGAGKTELGEAMRKELNMIEHIYLDNYFKSPKTFPLREGFLNWELPQNLKYDMLLMHLKQLKKNKTVRATLPYYIEGKRQFKKLILEPRPVV